MSHTERFPRRHPLCTCPPLTWTTLATLDRTKCAGGTTAHPVLDGTEAQQLVAAYIAQHAEESAP